MGTILRNAGELSSKRITFSDVAGSPFTLTAAWVKVCTTDGSIRGMRIVPIAAATADDIEWAVVTAGAAAPTDLYGERIGGGDYFENGIPIGDVYLKSASGQVALVRTGV